MGLCVLQDVSLPAGGNNSSIAAGTWLDPWDALLAQLPAKAVVNRCSPSTVGAVIYFCSFVLLCGLVLVNFIIGVIIDNFASSCQSDDLPISKDHVDQFAQVCYTITLSQHFTAAGWVQGQHAVECNTLKS